MFCSWKSVFCSHHVGWVLGEIQSLMKERGKNRKKHNYACAVAIKAHYRFGSLVLQQPIKTRPREWERQRNMYTEFKLCCSAVFSEILWLGTMDSNSIHIWLRAETKPNERRRALTPEKCRLLVERGELWLRKFVPWDVCFRLQLLFNPKIGM